MLITFLYWEKYLSWRFSLCLYQPAGDFRRSLFILLSGHFYLYFNDKDRTPDSLKHYIDCNCSHYLASTQIIRLGLWCSFLCTETWDSQSQVTLDWGTVTRSHWLHGCQSSDLMFDKAFAASRAGSDSHLDSYLKLQHSNYLIEFSVEIELQGYFCGTRPSLYIDGKSSLYVVQRSCKYY